MGLEKLESKEDERRLEDEKMEKADKLLKQENEEGEKKDIAEIAARAGKNAYDETLKTRLDSAGSGGKSEKAEFQEKAGPHLAEYESEVKAASAIKNPEDRKQALEKAYVALCEKLEGIKGTQEWRDAEKDRQRQSDEKKSAEDKDRERTLKFSEAVLKASKDLEVDRRLADIERRAKERAEMNLRTLEELKANSSEAKEGLKAMV